MPSTIQSLGLEKLSVDERIALAQELWDSVAVQVEESAVTGAQRQELERRLADSKARPDAVVPWEEVKAKALARARSC